MYVNRVQRLNRAYGFHLFLPETSFVTEKYQLIQQLKQAFQRFFFVEA